MSPSTGARGKDRRRARDRQESAPSLLLRLKLFLLPHTTPLIQELQRLPPHRPARTRVPRRLLGHLGNVVRCFPRLYSLNLPSASISAAADNEFPWVNNLKGCAPPYLKHLSLTARSVATRKSNTMLFANFPFHNEPFRINDLKTFEIKCVNQTDLVRLGRFLPHTLRTLKNLCIVKADNSVSGHGSKHPLPWCSSIRPLALDSSERLLIEIGLKVGYYADYLRWWIASLSEASIHPHPDVHGSAVPRQSGG
ncbi:hypothetical protein EDD18DRAFT_1181885 [Armillaria luteobubalina]|uniref:Uncharacterized protein n=1 Tax=Armillaria luteobubalina TaxID=153913 RepID=A0AA39TK83_9AGAR|nr:hypothetical protein EDD18DRAFT_1181885 [Armillaria luteobubalina]